MIWKSKGMKDEQEIAICWEGGGGKVDDMDNCKHVESECVQIIIKMGSKI